jgi:ferredoxin
VKVQIDPAMCQGHGRCYSLAPDVFDSDDEGHGLVITAEVAPQHEAGARAGERNCPESAITITED